MNGAVLRGVSLFADLPSADLEELATGLRRRRYARGQVIFTQGDPGSSLCVIEEGRVRIAVGSDEGKELVLRVLGPGDFFGEMALLDDEPRSATVVAMENLEIMTIWRQDFLQILQQNFSITKKVLAELSNRLRDAASRIESLATMDVYGRLARFFLELAKNDGKELENGYIAVTRPTHQAIANMIGTSRETVSRLIHDLMEQKLLVSEGKTIYLRKAALDQFRAST